MKATLKGAVNRVYFRALLLIGSLSTIALVLEAGRKWH